MQEYCASKVTFWVQNCSEAEKHTDLDNINKAIADPAFGYKLLESLANDFMTSDLDGNGRLNRREFM